jgi:predicted DNA-binding ribbon-helix-helix protein
MHKRSVTIDGHRTSISLEDAFWTELSAIARARGLSLNALVAEIDRARGAPPQGVYQGAGKGADTGGNLSSALRLHVLDELKRARRD